MTLRPGRIVIKSIQSWSMSLTRKHSKILAGLTNTARGVRPRFFRVFARTSTKPKRAQVVTQSQKHLLQILYSGNTACATPSFRYTYFSRTCIEIGSTFRKEVKTR
jgi:hypothetical protein